MVDLTSPTLDFILATASLLFDKDTTTHASFSTAFRRFLTIGFVHLSLEISGERARIRILNCTETPQGICLLVAFRRSSESWI